MVDSSYELEQTPQHVTELLKQLLKLRRRKGLANKPNATCHAKKNKKISQEANSMYGLVKQYDFTKNMLWLHG